MAKTIKTSTKSVQSTPETAKGNNKKLKDHDVFVRGLFSFTELVLKILHYVIPNDLKPLIDFSTLKPFSDMHISGKLLVTQSDTIYEAALNKDALPENVQKDEELPNFRFCFLSEFKSSKPSYPIDFQMDGYIRSIQKNDLDNNRPPSIVIALLIYHGVQEWKNKRLYDRFTPYLPRTAMQYIAAPKYLVIDLQAMTDDLIENAEDLGELRAAFLALKHAQDKKFFTTNLTEMLKFVEESPTTLLLQAYLEMLMEYFQRRSGLDDIAFNEIVEQSKSDTNMVKEVGGFKLFMKNTEQKGVEKGIEKGIALSEEKIEKSNRKTVANLILLTKLTDSQIANRMDLELVFVSNIRKVIELLALTNEQIAQKLGLTIAFVEDIRNQINLTEGLS